MEQSLQPDTGLKAKSDDFVSMLCNRDKMPDRMNHARKIEKMIRFSLKVVKKWSFGEGYTVWFDFVLLICVFPNEIVYLCSQSLKIFDGNGFL